MHFFNDETAKELKMESFRTKSRFATLCALVRASVSLHLHLRTSRILAERFHLRTSRILAERFYVIGNEVSYDIKNSTSSGHELVEKVFKIFKWVFLLILSIRIRGKYIVIKIIRIINIKLSKRNQNEYDRQDRQDASDD